MLKVQSIVIARKSKAVKVGLPIKFILYIPFSRFRKEYYQMHIQEELADIQTIKEEQHGY